MDGGRSRRKFRGVLEIMLIREKLRDFLHEDVDVDFMSSMTDEWEISFVGPVYLTEEGERLFSHLLDKDVIFETQARAASLDINKFSDDRDAQTLFFWAAGYCSCETYDKIFKEVE